jgi:hypothetical protein
MQSTRDPQGTAELLDALDRSLGGSPRLEPVGRDPERAGHIDVAVGVGLGVEAHDVGQQDRVEQSVREIERAADLVGDGVGCPEQRVGERHPGLEARPGHPLARREIEWILDRDRQVLGDSGDRRDREPLAQEVAGF